jgi:hypothetical protein
MSLTFLQAVNKIQAGKLLTRPSYINGEYFIMLHGLLAIYNVISGNLLNPTVPYILSVVDINATDWVEVIY